MGLVILGAVMAIFISTAVADSYRSSMEEHYAEDAFAYAHLVAEYVDGDKIREYQNTLTEDEYYNNVREFLLEIKESAKLTYCYVVVPEDEQMLYIWDAGDEGDSNICSLGDRESYYDGGKENMHSAFSVDAEDEILITNNDKYGYLASAYVAILDSSGAPAALASVDISMNEIGRQIFTFQALIISIICGVLIVAIFLYYLFINRQVVIPIKKLNTAATELVSNMENLDSFSMDIHTGDEIEALSMAFKQMTVELSEYIRNLSEVTAEKERIGAELKVATQIQASMLPCIFPPFPERKEFDLYATMKPAKEVGGDFYDFFLIDDDHLAMVIADVSGKGVPAALFMVIAKTLIKNQAQMGKSPKEILETVNNQLCENNDAGMFVTAWIGIYEISTHTLKAANAGHENPVLKKQGKLFELVRDKHGLVLAAMQNMKYSEYEIKLDRGDIIFVYTDGVTEATDEQGKLYGSQRMIEALNSNSCQEPQDLLKALSCDISAFVGNAAQFDDITMLIFRVNL